MAASEFARSQRKGTKSNWGYFWGYQKQIPVKRCRRNKEIYACFMLLMIEDEAYALLTLINLSKDLYPGIVQRYTSVVRSVLKFSLHGRGFLMKRLDEKFGVEMPGIQDYDHGVAQRLGRALTDDLLIEASWREGNTIKKAQCYVRHAALRQDGWYITIEDARGRNKGCLYDLPLAAFVHCVIKGRPNKETN